MHPTTRCSAVNLPDVVKMLSGFRTLMEENACASLLVEQPIGVPVPVTSRSHEPGGGLLPDRFKYHMMKYYGISA